MNNRAQSRTPLPWLGETAGARSARSAMLAIPGHEIGEQTQARLLTLFRVKLHSEHIVALEHGGEIVAVESCASAVRGIGGRGVITVHEIETAVLHIAFPLRMGPGVMYLVPTHVRLFETLAAGSILQGRSEPAHLAFLET